MHVLVCLLKIIYILFISQLFWEKEIPYIYNVEFSLILILPNFFKKMLLINYFNYSTTKKDMYNFFFFINSINKYYVTIIIGKRK